MKHRQQITWMVLAAFVIMVVSLSMATLATEKVGGGDLCYPSTKGTVTFSHAKHKTAGLACKDCHMAGAIFTKMKHNGNGITMAGINKGQFCGKCHNGTKAFAAKECGKCHVN